MILTLPAYAKINLTLEVLGQRSDGYHEITSVFQTINLADTLSFKLDDMIRFAPQDHHPYSLESPGKLVMKAARLLQEVTGCNKGALIRFWQGIPHPSGGLGASSSNAAATLQALNKLWQLNLSLPRLTELAMRLGSDVTFFLYGGTALVEGRGGKVTPLPDLGENWLLLVKPPVAIPPNKTKRLYTGLRQTHFTQGQATQRLVDLLRHDGMLQPSLIFNVFEHIAFDLFPGLGEYREHLLALGIPSVHLTGAGPTLFSLVPNRTQGEELRQRLQEERVEVWLVQPIGAPLPIQAGGS